MIRPTNKTIELTMFKETKCKLVIISTEYRKLKKYINKFEK